MPVFLLLAAVAVDGCAFARAPVEMGAIISESDIMRGPCPDEPVPAKLRYDVRRGVAVARYPLLKSEALGRVYLPPRPEVLPGDRVELVARIGHIVVRREMTALQVARTSQRYFVRDSDGQVVLAPKLAGSDRR
jgi:flagella basal body P-ring formation protein FlgA